MKIGILLLSPLLVIVGVVVLIVVEVVVQVVVEAVVVPMQIGGK